MTDKRLRVAILWHMHQPYYRDLATGRSRLPWVRLHAVKNYHPMASILERHPSVSLTFNMVPCLVRQILEYGEGLTDDFLDLSRKPAADLDAGDRLFVLNNFFMTNWEGTIRPRPRYSELLEKRGTEAAGDDLERAAGFFSSQDLLDLQVWFNLVWFHPLTL